MRPKEVDEKKQEHNIPHKPINEHIEKNVHNVVEKAEEEVDRSRVPWYRASKRAYILIGIYIVQLTLFALLAWWVHIHPVLAIDVSITHEFQENQAPWLKYTMIAVSYIGNVWFLSVGLVLLAAVIFWLVRLRLEAIMIIVVSATSAALNGLIKLLVERPRPTARLVEIIQRAGGQSFPSGHVMAYLAFWGLLFSFGVILFKRDRWWQYAILIIPALFVVLVGPSRVYLGDHWASDVLGAYLIGGVWLGISLWIYLKLKERGILTRNRRGGKLKKVFTNG